MFQQTKEDSRQYCMINKLQTNQKEDYHFEGKQKANQRPAKNKEKF